MATTATAGRPIFNQAGRSLKRLGSLIRGLLPQPGLRSRQIALITLLVIAVVLIATVANIASMTGVIITRTQDQAGQLSSQLAYAIQQELAHNVPVDQLSSPYTAIASETSGVRELMESTIAASRGNPIIYLYLTNEAGQIIKDLNGKHELAANRFMIGDTSVVRPDLRQLASQNAYLQLARVFFGAPIYESRSEFSAEVTGEEVINGKLHIGVSASAVRSELRTPIATNLFIGLFAILGAAVVAITSANLLLKPLQAISTSIDRLETGSEPEVGEPPLPKDEMVSGVTARLRQLSERLAGERSELEIMRGRLRQVISHLEERLLLINREGRVMLASPDAEDLLGARDTELTGLSIYDSLTQSHPVVRLAERSLNARRSIARTPLTVHDGARNRQLLVSAQYIEDSGEPVGVLLSMRDFESFQKFESQWDLSKKLADLGRITSGIAHEVKNPLNAMVIHLAILRSKLESHDGDPAPQIEILDSEIKRLDRVVQTFLNFTRPLDVHLEPLELNRIVGQVVALASIEAQEHGVQISLRTAPGRLLIKGDSDLLKQALLNIIINGCQSMPDGGPLDVVTSRHADGSARILIRDKGVGIPPEARDRIFKLYYTTKQGGSGIGLAQAYRAIQLHNGQIRFDSEAGVGTTFEITLSGA